MSLLTGWNAIDPNTSRAVRQHQSLSWENDIPNKVVRDSVASRNSLVETALSFSLSTGTSVKDFFTVSRKVPPGGYAFVDAIMVLRLFVLFRGGIGSFLRVAVEQGGG